MTGRFPRSSAALVLIALAASSATAQRSGGASPRQGAECPMVGGISATVTVRDSANTPSRDIVRVDRNTSVDTTFTFNVAERRWSVAEMAASVAAGLADTVRGRWYLCAGAAVGLSRPTLVVRGARGQVRLRASLGDLSRLLSMRAPQGEPVRTPPRRS